LSAPVAAALVYCDGKEPTLENALAAESPEAEIGRKEDFLANIFDFSGPAEQPIGQSPDVSRVSFDDSVKSRFVASTELFDQKLIINRLGHGYNIRLPARRNLTEKLEGMRKKTRDEG
jgi:hypothetical protein